MIVKLMVLGCWTSTILSCAKAITLDGKRQAPGLIPLNPVGIYGSLDVSITRLTPTLERCDMMIVAFHVCGCGWDMTSLSLQLKRT